MAKEPEQMSMPILGMLVLGIAGAVTVAAQVEVINYWPQPVAVAPYFHWETGLLWGLIAGGAFGLIVGFIADEKHYPDMTHSGFAEPKK